MKEAERINQSEFLEVFARTGHDALKALLIVSCGSAVTFLALVGALMGSEQVAPFMKAAIPGFQAAITMFIISIMLSLIAYAFAFLSHAAYYLRLQPGLSEKEYTTRGRWARSLTIAAMVVEFFCIASFVWGGIEAASALATLVGEATK